MKYRQVVIIKNKKFVWKCPIYVSLEWQVEDLTVNLLCFRVQTKTYFIYILFLEIYNLILLIILYYYFFKKKKHVAFSMKLLAMTFASCDIFSKYIMLRHYITCMNGYDYDFDQSCNQKFNINKLFKI